MSSSEHAEFSSKDFEISDIIENGYSNSTTLPRCTVYVPPPLFLVPINRIISFNLYSKVMERIRKETRNWASLNWRNPERGERFWGHVYLPIDSKIVKIVKEFYQESELIGKIKEILDERGSIEQNVDYDVLWLPPHVTVLSHSEFQCAFLDLEKDQVEEFDLVHCHSSFNSPIEHENSEYESKGADVKERKFQELMNFKLFETSYFAKSLPDEITLYIKNFLLLDLKEIGSRFEYSLTGRISLVPRYYGSGNCGFVLHVKSPQLSQLRKHYGFTSEKQLVIPLGKVKHSRI